MIKICYWLTIADSIKEDAQEAVNKLHNSMKVKTTMLSGDKSP